MDINLEKFPFLAKKRAFVGKLAPDFTLPDLDGGRVTLSQMRGSIVVLDWWSAECPASARYDAWFSRKYPQWLGQGIRFLAVDSNSIYDDNEIRRIRRERHLPFPILRDYGAVVADLYGARTTPHGYVISREGVLVYEGAIDDQSWARTTPTVNYLERVLSSMLAGKDCGIKEVEPFGCSVKRGW
ncbi:MAG: redoxin domain-containing protein [bacterium JZ-2024 1]